VNLVLKSMDTTVQNTYHKFGKITNNLKINDF
jgi:hypothetical protein